jgi:hypothetical protein
MTLGYARSPEIVMSDKHDGKKSELKKRQWLLRRVKRIIASPVVFRFLLEVVWKLWDRYSE